MLRRMKGRKVGGGDGDVGCLTNYVPAIGEIRGCVKK